MTRLFRTITRLLHPITRPLRGYYTPLRDHYAAITHYYVTITYITQALRVIHVLRSITCITRLLHLYYWACDPTITQVHTPS